MRKGTEKGGVAGPPTDALRASIEVALAEFTELRAEIAARSRSQEQYSALALTAAATIAGVVVTHPESRALLLVVVFIGPLLGFLYLDHARTIDRIGDYVRTTVATRVRIDVEALATVGGPSAESAAKDLMAWEDTVYEQRQRVGLRGLLLGPGLLPFALAPIAAAVAARDPEHSLSELGLWGLRVGGLMLVLLFIWNWLLWITVCTPAEGPRVLRWLHRRGPTV